MACNDRQLTEAQRQAGYDQQRTGVQRAIRPFSGSPTIENLVDYVNRELCPAVRSTREKVNDTYLQVMDQAPSANPLAFYFSTTTTNADPTTGRIRLNQAIQNTATVLRISQTNGRQQDATPWLDVMSGGPTTPLGVVTLIDSINPSRFLRFDLNTMTDQGAYWDLGVTIVESSTASPFVDDEAVVVAFIAGVSAAGSTIPVGSISPIPADTFIGNITTGTAAPVAVQLASVDSTSVAYDATTHEFRRAALTGAIAATANSNATLFAGIRDNGSAENDRTNLNHLSTTSIIAVVTDDSINDELEMTHERAALTGFAAASQNSNATTSAEPIVTYSASANMSAERVLSAGNSTTIDVATAAQIQVDYSGSLTTINSASTSGDLNVVDISTLECGGVLTFQSVTEANIDGFTAKTDGFWFLLSIRDATTSESVTLIENNGNTTTSIRTPNIRDWRMTKNDSVLIFYSNSRWHVAASFPKPFVVPSDSVTWASQQDDFTRTGRGYFHIRVTLTGDQTLTGVVPDGITPNGELLYIENVDSVDTLTISHDATSTAANRFLCPGGAALALTPRTGGVFRYDSTSSRWRCISTSAGASTALTGEVTTSGAAATVTRSTDYASTPWTGAHTFNNTVSLGQKIVYTGVISPTAISADQNDYNPTGWSTANFVRLTTSSIVGRTITGVQAGTAGEFKWLANVGTGFINLDVTSTASSAANRFLVGSGTSYTMTDNSMVGLLYDGTTSRWRIIRG